LDFIKIITTNKHPLSNPWDFRLHTPKNIIPEFSTSAAIASTRGTLAIVAQALGI
jgi:hypothetical protein